MRCPVYAAQYLMEALFENGQSNAALGLMTADNDRSWKHMVDSGTTITWEAWDQKYKPNQDWNHAWGAAPANLLPRYVLGAEAIRPGWRLASIRPLTGDLRFAKGRIPTPRGPILFDWTRDTAFAISLTLPAGISARIDLPAPAESNGVFANGEKVAAKRDGSRWILSSEVNGTTNLQVK
jgi:hypothetical protein